MGGAADVAVEAHGDIDAESCAEGKSCGLLKQIPKRMMHQVERIPCRGDVHVVGRLLSRGKAVRAFREEEAHVAVVGALLVAGTHMANRVT